MERVSVIGLRMMGELSFTSAILITTDTMLRPLMGTVLLKLAMRKAYNQTTQCKNRLVQQYFVQLTRPSLALI
jgi:hypothetical protein